MSDKKLKEVQSSHDIFDQNWPSGFKGCQKKLFLLLVTAVIFEGCQICSTNILVQIGPVIS